MKFKGFWYDGLMIFVAAAFAIAFIIMTFFFDSRLALAECMGFVLVCVIAVYRALSAKNRYKKFLIKTARKLDYKNSKVLSEFPFPVAVCDAEGCVTWCNNRFLAEIAKEVLESSDRIIDNYLMMELIGTDSLEEKRKKMSKVTKREIVKVAKKVKIDTVFLLEGGK